MSVLDHLVHVIGENLKKVETGILGQNIGKKYDL
tara:strand:- start:748 stop:849 length:102 start_codon:yes stop_codon:yes gene_type:complete